MICLCVMKLNFQELTLPCACAPSVLSRGGECHAWGVTRGVTDLRLGILEQIKA